MDDDGKVFFLIILIGCLVIVAFLFGGVYQKANFPDVECTKEAPRKIGEPVVCVEYKRKDVK